MGVDNGESQWRIQGRCLGGPRPHPPPPLTQERSSGTPYLFIFRPNWGPKFITRLEGWKLKTEEEGWYTGTRNVLFWKNAILTLLVNMFHDQIKTQLASICNPFVCLPYSSVIIHWFIVCSSHVRESKTVLGRVPLGWSGSGTVTPDYLDHGRSTEPMNPCQSGLVSSTDLPWSEWSRITDPDPDHPKGTHP